MSEYVYLWEFRVAAGKRDAFLAAYGQGGAWEKLFRKAQGYVGTMLLESRTHSDVFVTVDRWESVEAFHAFREQFALEYAEIDRACEQFTTREREIGTFDAVF